MHEHDARPDPSFEDILDWLEGRLPATQAAAVQQRVADGSPTLQSTVNWLRAYARTARQVHLGSAPTMHDRLRRMFDDAKVGRRPTLPKQYAASVRPGGGLPADLPGLRSDPNLAPRHVMCSSEIADIVMHLHPIRDAVTMYGQVFSSTPVLKPAHLVVQLLHNTIESGITTTDVTGVFQFEAITAGRYALIVSSDDVDILSDTFDTGA
jgi:hypothetical protein